MPHFTYVNNTRRYNISNESGVLVCAYTDPCGRRLSDEVEGVRKDERGLDTHSSLEEFHMDTSSHLKLDNSKNGFSKVNLSVK